MLFFINFYQLFGKIIRIMIQINNLKLLAMFTKIEIAERLLLQMQIEEAELQAQMIEAISQWSDEVLKKEVKTACGGQLMRISHNQYIIN